MPEVYGILMRDGVNYSHDTAESISYTNTSSGLTATDVQAAIDEIYNRSIPTNGGTTSKYLRGDGTWQVPPNDTYAVMSSGTTGLAPKGTADKFLRGDATWQTPINTTYPIVSTTTAGLVPKLNAGATVNYLRGDGTWQKPDNDTYAVATTAKDGLVRSGGTSAKYLRADGTWQTPPNNTYAVMSSGTTGLAPKGTSGKFLRGDATWDTPPDSNDFVNTIATTASAQYRVLYATDGTTTASQTTTSYKGGLLFNTSNFQTRFYDATNTRYSILGINNYYLRWASSDPICRIIHDGSQSMEFRASNEASYGVTIGVADSMWYWGPTTSSKLHGGHASYKWSTVYAASASIDTSDRNQKENIIDLDSSAKDFIMDLKPVSYKFKNNGEGDPHDRTHYGLIAQDVEDTMTKMGMTALDFGGFCKDQKVEQSKENPDVSVPVEGVYIYGLRYEEFIAPIIKTIQMQEEDVNYQDDELSEIKSRLDILENK